MSKSNQKAAKNKACDCENQPWNSLMPLPARFWSKVCKHGEGGCWEWLGYANTARGGYGRIEIYGALLYVHRYSWMLVNGPIPGGLHVCHSCDNPVCVNPDHLWLGTNQENLADMTAKGRRRWGNLPMPGERNPMSRLTEAEVLHMRTLHKQGWMQKDLAGRFGVSKMTVSRAVRGETWSHL